MSLILKLAWRNCMRNKRRTIFAVIILSIGLAALIFTDSFLKGMDQYMINAATKTFLGQGQIHREGFLTTYDLNRIITDGPEILKRLEKESIVKNYTPRVISVGMITSPANVTGISLTGIDPDLEKPISSIDEVLIDGDYLNSGEQNKILIGSKLAERLETGIGDRVVLSVAQSGTGNLMQEVFRIAGIFRFNVKQMDDFMIFINIRKSQELLNLSDNIHEISINFNDIHFADNFSHPFWNGYSKNENEALSWKKIMPELVLAIEFSFLLFLIVNFILSGIIALGITNTLFMSLYERMFEFGILRAVGTRASRLVFMIICEAGVLAVLSIIIGNILGFIITNIISINGISFEGIEYGGITFSQPIYAIYEVSQYIIFPIYLFLFSCFVGLYPAIHAARISPKEALEKSL